VPKTRGKLTAKRRRFVEEYLVDLNGTQAAIRAGYSKRSAGQTAGELLKKPEIANEIQKAKQERSKRTNITQDEVLEMLAEMARADIRDYMDWDETLARFIPKADMKAPTRLIQSIKSTQTKDGGSCEIKLYSRNDAIEKLMRHLGMFDEPEKDDAQEYHVVVNLGEPTTQPDGAEDE
jgi:phage terminase small subunit